MLCKVLSTLSDTPLVQPTYFVSSCAAKYRLMRWQGGLMALHCGAGVPSSSIAAEHETTHQVLHSVDACTLDPD